jgi:oxygen-independent coproporphyrinogen-3 oxidase
LSIDISDVDTSFALTIEGDISGYMLKRETFKYLDSKDKITVKRLLKRTMKKHIYKLLEQKYKSSSKWGILVGIRPVKLFHELYASGKEVEEIRSILSEEYLMHKEKINLIIEIGIKEAKYLYPVDKRKVSLYVCIPFCPTRCLYCSFPSNDMASKGKLMEDYISSLLKELSSIMPVMKDKGLIVENLYIGGGTPTTLSSEQFSRIFDEISKYIDLNSLKEFTVEAGRPDTITDEKLSILKSYGVDRICINPQTMNDETLVKIGRNHSSGEIVEIYELIKKYDFKTINCDLILGLIDEDIEDIKYTLDKIVDLKPENITVHTLAVKRSSRLNEKISDYKLSMGNDVENMMEYAKNYLKAHGYGPYYLYRQKNMIGNLENIGFALEGHESSYNIQIMEEMQTIIGFGAGATSKIVAPDNSRFDNIPNIKGLEEYIARVEDNIEKKLNYLNALT